jgi:hypothetical protein
MIPAALDSLPLAFVLFVMLRSWCPRQSALKPRDSRSARDAPAHDVLETIATMCVRASADLVAVARLLAAVDGQPRGTAPAREV